jgi:hypothetical protein
MRFTWTTLAAGIVAVALLTGGQEPGKGQKKDAQERFEPRGEPGAGQKYLQKYVGEFDVAKTLTFREDQPVKSTGTCKQTLVLEGRFLQSDFVFEGAGGKTTGLGLIGFESSTKLFTSIWVDSRQTKMSIRQSKTPFDGEQIVLFSKSLAEDGRAGGRQSKTVTILEDDGRKIVHRQYNKTPDGKERVVMELVLTRKAAPTGR